MRKIFKYDVSLGNVCAVLMPRDAKVLCAREQEGRVMIWALVDPAAFSEERRFVIYGTGEAIYTDARTLECPGEHIYIDTVLAADGYVWHVFEVVR